MDSIIYNYLIKHENDNDNKLFLDCLLILSLNKINIDYNTLLHYCNNKNNNNNLLNSNQLQLLNKIIKSLNNQSISTSTIIEDHQISKRKLDCSILIIIENNLNLKKEEQTQQQISSSSSNDDDVDSGSSDDKNYLLFKKVWGNLIIRNEIMFHLRLYRIHKDNVTFYFKKLKKYKYKSYLNKLTIVADGEEEDEEGINVFTAEHCKYISSSVRELEIYSFNKMEKRSLPSTICKLGFDTCMNQKITKSLFNDSVIGSDNITELHLDNGFNQSLSDTTGKPWLPRNLKSVKFGEDFQQDISPGQLPNSLTSIKFYNNYRGRILPNSVPKSVTTLDYTFNSNNNKSKIDNYLVVIPSSTTNLKFDDSFNQVIEIGYIPQNVTSITFGSSFNSTIKVGSLPQSLQSLKFGWCFNQPLYNNNNNNQSFIPTSITKLHFDFGFKQSINSNTFKPFKNLEHLIFDCDTSFKLGMNSLPNSIKSLNLKNLDLLNSNPLPSSLTSFTYSDYNLYSPPQFSLPNSITSLCINKINSLENIPNPLPSNLKTITISSLSVINKDDDLSSINWPASLETIYIDHRCFSLFNNKVSTDFFIKYIKPINNNYNGYFSN